MLKYIEVEASAKSYSDAVEAALADAASQIGSSREELTTYELLDKTKTGFLGLGGVSVKLKVSYEAPEEVLAPEAGARAEAFLGGLFELMHISAKLDVKDVVDEGRVDVTLSGDDMGSVIGRRGETLDAIQYITGLAVNRGAEKFVRVSIDTENYREKREESLEKLAKKTAEKAVKLGRSLTLEPMSPQERRVIHTVLQDYPGITTYSTGTDPNRRVVVALKREDGTTAPASTYSPQQRRRRPQNKSKPKQPPAQIADKE